MKYIAIAISFLFLYSCEKREDFYKNDNGNPSFPISGTANEWSNSDGLEMSINDSLKLSKSYTIGYAMWDDNKGMQVSVSKPKHGKILSEEKEINYDSYFPVPFEYGTFRYVPSGVGEERITFNAKDIYGAETSSKLNLHVFENYEPVAVISESDIIKKGNLHPLEYEFDASKSFDKDEKFGGGLNAFLFIVDGDTTIYPEAKMKYIFAREGEYDISVRCRDNDNLWSDYVILGKFQVK